MKVDVESFCCNNLLQDIKFRHRYFNNIFHEFNVLKKLIRTKMFNLDFHNNFIKFWIILFFSTLSLSLSLSHTHTHTHTLSLSLSVSLSLSLSLSLYIYIYIYATHVIQSSSDELSTLISDCTQYKQTKTNTNTNAL